MLTNCYERQQSGNILQDVTGIINMCVCVCVWDCEWPGVISLFYVKSYMYKIVDLHHKQSLVRTMPPQPSIGIFET